MRVMRCERTSRLRFMSGEEHKFMFEQNLMTESRPPLHKGLAERAGPSIRRR